VQERAPGDDYVWVYRSILVIGSIGVPVLGMGDWLKDSPGEVFEVRLVFTAVALIGVAVSFVDGWHVILRGVCLAVVGAMLAWFLRVAVVDSFGAPDVVGLAPIVMAAAVLVRHRVELLAISAILYAGVAAAFVLVPEPQIPLDMMTVLLSVLLWPAGLLSLGRARLEADLLEANQTLEERVRQRTADLARAEAEARQASEAKSRFLANMSHELRTPLNGVIGHIELADEDLEDRDDDELAAVRDDLRRAHDAAGHLLRLIDDVLDLTMIEAGALSFEPAPCGVRAAVHGAVDVVRSAIDARGNTVAIDIAEALTAYADPARVRQVLVNLLGNANKFTTNGAITITGRADGAQVHIAVRDTGVGIAPEQLSRIFDRFHQADDSSTRSTDGSGLGLAVTRELLQRMGGQVEVESAPGEGSTFTVTLPAHR
jgi:signal transduction histidine kinase